MHISTGLWEEQKLKADGENKHSAYEANLEHAITLLLLAGVRALHPFPTSGVQVCLATQKEALIGLTLGDCGRESGWSCYQAEKECILVSGKECSRGRCGSGFVR